MQESFLSGRGRYKRTG